MRTKLFIPVVVAILSAAALLGAACSDDGGDSGGSQPTTEGQGSVSGPTSAGAIVPNMLLTFEGVQYRLVQILQADLIDGSGFTQAGQASQLDVDGDPTVYTRGGDDGAVYTFFPATGSGEEALPGSWYRWEREG